MNLGTVAIVIGFLLGVHELLKDKISKKYKVPIYIGVLLLLSTAAFIEKNKELNKDEADETLKTQRENESTKREREYQNIITQSNSALQKSAAILQNTTVTIDSLHNIQQSALLILDSMTIQLALQHRINATSEVIVDSLKSVQQGNLSIIKNTISQLKLQASAIDSSHALLLKNEELLGTQSLVYKKVDRLLNPFFPINIVIRMQVPLDDSSLSRFNITFDQVKNDIENKSANKSNINTNLLYPIFEQDKISTIEGNVDSFSIISNILKTLIDTTYISFYLSNEIDPLRVISNPPQTRFALYSKGKFGHCNKIFIIDYKRRLLFIEFTYEDYEFEIFGNTIYGNKIGISDIMDSYLTLNNSVLSNFKIGEIFFFKKGRQEIYHIKFTAKEIVNTNLFNNKVSEFFIHKIVSSDTYYLQ